MMDFFQHQEQARKRTVLLVVLYCIAVGMLIAAIYGLVVFLAMVSDEQWARQLEQNFFLDPFLLFWTACGVALVVGGGSLFKISELAVGGGRGLAESLGGRQISPTTRDPAERRLYNVVEEMALASGVPVPTIFIMDNEPGINAFAAGFSHREAVIGVNRGTVELLTRDELQGVIGHEFSHILNGDMRMNLRLIGILFGLQLIMLIGYYAMRISYYASLGGSSNRNDDNKGGAGIGIVILLAGIGMMILGAIGVFFSSMIKAAISRQREFLADASAVQFTRNPAGIAGALKKIGCPDVGSEVRNEHAAESSHLFFGDVCQMFSLGNLLATHPPLAIRIKRIDPSFDGRFPAHISPVNFYDEPEKPKPKVDPTAPLDPLRKLNPLGSLEQVGGINLGQLIIAGGLLDSIPNEVSKNARDPLSAKAVFYATLLDDDPNVRNSQFAAITSKESQFSLQKTRELFVHIREIPVEARIPLLQRITSSLRQLSVEQYMQFSTVVDMLIAADHKMSLFEYTLKAILLRDLDVYFGLAQPITPKYSTLDSVRQPFIAVLSDIAYAGHETVEEAQNAFAASMDQLRFSGTMLSGEQCSPLLFDQSLRTLALTTPALKKSIFQALMACIQHDGQITVREGELIRAIAAMLAIPMPDFRSN